MRQTIILSLVILMVSCQKEVTTSNVLSATTTDSKAITGTFKYVYPVEFRDYNGCTGQEIYVKGNTYIVLHSTFIPGSKLVSTFQANGIDTATEISTGIVTPIIAHESWTIIGTWDSQSNTWILNTDNITAQALYMSPQGISVVFTVNYHIIISADGTLRVDKILYSYACR